MTLGDVSLQRLRLQVMWDRVLAMVEEQAQVLMRTAFSTAVRECGDLSAGLFTTEGQMMAQSITGTPGHVNSMAQSVGQFLKRFPATAMCRGDVFITNDPWQGTGHLNDFVIVTPTYHEGNLVALFACTSHLTDVGGIGFIPDATDVFMEGTRIPIQKLYSKGVINDCLIDVIKANTRLPRETEGDIYALVACNKIGARRLAEMMSELNISSLDALAEHIFHHSQIAVEREVRKLRPGAYRNTMRIDGFGTPIDLVAALTIEDGRISVDFSGTLGLSEHGINVPLSYTAAYACFGLACAVAPQVPNNAGSLSAYSISAPANSILNALFPAPVSARHVIGQMLPDVIFGCLADVIPERIPAEGTSCTWAMVVKGVSSDEHSDGPVYVLSAIMNGGMGARPTKDGLSATAFPSGVRCTPVEIAEASAPILFWKKEYRADSGGRGCYRGGDGLHIEMEVTNGLSFELRPSLDRILHPARGRMGGTAGEPGYLGLLSGRILNGMGSQKVSSNERVIMLTPGGGGYGDPGTRDHASIEEDMRDGIIAEAPPIR